MVVYFLKPLAFALPFMFVTSLHGCLAMHSQRAVQAPAQELPAAAQAPISTDVHTVMGAEGTRSGGDDMVVYTPFARAILVPIEGGEQLGTVELAAASTSIRATTAIQSLPPGRYTLSVAASSACIHHANEDMGELLPIADFQVSRAKAGENVSILEIPPALSVEPSDFIDLPVVLRSSDGTPVACGQLNQLRII